MGSCLSTPDAGAAPWPGAPKPGAAGAAGAPWPGAAHAAGFLAERAASVASSARCPSGTARCASAASSGGRPDLQMDALLHVRRPASLPPPPPIASRGPPWPRPSAPPRGAQPGRGARAPACARARRPQPPPPGASRSGGLSASPSRALTRAPAAAAPPTPPRQVHEFQNSLAAVSDAPGLGLSEAAELLQAELGAALVRWAVRARAAGMHQRGLNKPSRAAFAGGWAGLCMGRAPQRGGGGGWRRVAAGWALGKFPPAGAVPPPSHRACPAPTPRPRLIHPPTPLQHLWLLPGGGRRAADRRACRGPGRCAARRVRRRRRRPGALPRGH
jgi:hypothetical protein